MKRRTLVTGLAGMAALGALGPGGQDLAIEATRLGLATARGRDAEAWDRAVTSCASLYQTADPSAVIARVQRQLIILQQVLTADPNSRDLRRVAALLGVIMATALTDSGDPYSARAWWEDAADAADESGCTQTTALVRGRQAVDALYGGGYRVPELVTMAAAPVDRPCVGAAEQLGGRAQLHAQLGQRSDAQRALDQLSDVYAALPPAATSDDGIFGWPEYRLHHTASWVHTHLGDTSAAYPAQDHALALYPSGSREAVMVRLHRARCLVVDREVSTGLATAVAAIDGLPEVRLTDPIGVLAQGVLATLPAAEKRRPVARELQNRLVGRALV